MDEADTLAQIGAATFLETYAGWLPGLDILRHCRTQHTHAAYTKLFQQPAMAAWLVETKEAPVGYAVLTEPNFPKELGKPGDLELKRIYLFSRYHATGLADALLQEVISHSTGKGATRLLVGLHRENARAFRFYQKHGFKEIGTRTFQMGGETFTDPVLARML